MTAKKQTTNRLNPSPEGLQLPAVLKDINGYIVGLGFVVGVMQLAVLRLVIESDAIYIIRLHQMVGWTALAAWYVLLLIGPLAFVLRGERMQAIAAQKKSIGLVVAYFAAIHGYIGITDRVGGFDGLFLLPTVFQWSVVCGILALTVVLGMAVVSLSPAAKSLSPKAWKVLGRINRVAALAIIFHVWLIGNHVGFTPVKELFFVAIVALLLLEAYKIIATTSGARLLQSRYAGVFTIAVVGIVIAITMAIPARTSNYASLHKHDENAEFGAGHDH